MAVFCHPYRVRISDLAIQLQTNTQLPEGIIRAVLENSNFEPKSSEVAAYNALGVSHPKDKVTPLENEQCRRDIEVRFCLNETDKKSCINKYASQLCFTKENSITEAEVSRFVYQVARFNSQFRSYYNFYNRRTEEAFPPIKPNDPKVIIALELHKIFYGDYPLYEAPQGTANDIPPHEISPVKFYGSCYDGDTCNIAVWKPYECFQQGILGFYGSARESQVDSAEACPSNCLRWADDRCVVKACVPAFIPEEAKTWTLAKLLNPDFGKRPDEQPAQETGIRFKTKFVENCVNIFRELVVGQKFRYAPLNPAKFFGEFSREEVFQSLRLIGAWHDYASEIDAAIMNDFRAYAQDVRRKNLGTRGTTIRYTAEDTPKHLTGMWVPYDIYLRRLVSYQVEDTSIIDGYLTTELPKTLHKLIPLYNERKKAIDVLASGLEKSANPKIRELAQKLDGKHLKSPVDIFSGILNMDPGVANALTTFFRKYPAYRTSWTLRRVLIGSVSDYRKYRSQEYPAFGAAGKIAKDYKLGLWGSDPTLVALWTYYLRIPRYKPRDSLTGEDGPEPTTSSFLHGPH